MVPFNSTSGGILPRVGRPPIRCNNDVCNHSSLKTASLKQVNMLILTTLPAGSMYWPSKKTEDQGCMEQELSICQMMIRAESTK